MIDTLSADRQLAGGIVQFPGTISRVRSLCRPEDMRDPMARRVYATVLELESQGESIDLVNVTTSVIARGGKPVDVPELVRSTSTSEAVVSAARIIRERSIRESVAERAAGIHREATDPHSDPFRLITDLQQAAVDLSARSSPGHARSISELIPGVLADIEKAMTDRAAGKPSGLPTSLEVLDDRFGGWRKSDLTIIAARPGMGKTALALQITEAVAEAETPALIFSLEMSASQLISRLASAGSGYPVQDIIRGNLSAGGLDVVAQDLRRIDRLPIYIDDSGSSDLADIMSRARRYVLEKGVGLIVLDFIQLVDVAGSEGRTDEVSTVARSLKNLAKQLDVSVIALSQLNRGVEGRQHKRPNLADLKESGSLEEAADIVIFVYRPWYYPEGADVGQYNGVGVPHPPTYVELITAKYRNGETGIDEVRWKPEIARFDNCPIYDPTGEEAF